MNGFVFQKEEKLPKSGGDVKNSEDISTFDAPKPQRQSKVAKRAS